jgi:hypothetical protein
MKRHLLTAFAVAMGLALSAGAALAQSTTTTAGGGGGGTGSAPTNPNNASHEIDLPIGMSHQVAVVPEEDPNPPIDEDDEPNLYNEDLPTKDESIIYVLDISGSMDWGTSTFTGLDGNPTTGSKLDRAKVELIRSIQALSDNFLFNVFAFDCDIYRWSAARQRAVPAAKASAAGWVSSRRALGATGTGPAMAAALADRDNHTCVLLTDGAPNCIGDNWSATINDHRRMIRSSNLQQAVIHCFGIGAYGEFEQFCRDVAADNGGRYYAVP